MRLATWTVLLLLAVPQFEWGQTNGASKEVNQDGAARPRLQNNYSVIGATPRQETLLRAQIQVMNAEILPLRIVFVPHSKYLDTARTFRLHVPTGYTSVMFTHLPSRTVFIDADRYIKDDSLVYWMAHELGHLATNSTKEGDAEKAAGKFRSRLKESEKFAAQAAKP